MGFRFTTRAGHPTFVDLPWEQPLAEWDTDRLVAPVRGISRHVVRFVAYGPDLYALKELPDRLAEKEYRLLRELDERLVPVVEAVGVATGRTAAGEPLDDVLITRHLRYSLPYRALFGQASLAALWDPMLDALAQLIVRAHLAGFFWGDCSLSNTLFRRDAGALAAWLVDAETGELHDRLSDGQRDHDLTIAEVNVAGELLDIMAAVAESGGATLPADDPRTDAAAVAEDLRRRYDALWHELTTVEVFGAGEEWRVDERVRRLNDLGFDVDEMELVDDPNHPDGHVLRLTTRVVEPGHHRRRLLQLIGPRRAGEPGAAPAQRHPGLPRLARAAQRRAGGRAGCRPALDGRGVRADARRGARRAARQAGGRRDLPPDPGAPLVPVRAEGRGRRDGGRDRRLPGRGAAVGRGRADGAGPAADQRDPDRRSVTMR